MKSSAEILAEVREIFKTKWKSRDGKKVPDADDVTLGNDAVTIDGTVLYADMADSTNLVNNFKNWFAAEVYKAYLVSACHIIKNNDGTITAFDGDRVMAVYIGDGKNSAAAKSALQINAFVRKINAEIKSAYPNTSFVLRQSIGIDTSALFAAKTGIRNSNDLVWVGRSANYAAKLSSLADQSYSTFITEEVFSKLNEASKYGGTPRQSMWEKGNWQERRMTIYKSSWWWDL